MTLRCLILAPMTCGKTTVVNKALAEGIDCVSGDWPFEANTRFAQAWKRHAQLGRPALPGPWGGGHPWTIKDQVTLAFLQPTFYATHQSLALAEWALTQGADVVGFLPVSDASQLYERWRHLRPSWVTNDTDAYVKAKRAFEEMEAIGLRGGHLLRSWSEIDSFTREMLRRGALLSEASAGCDGSSDPSFGKRGQLQELFFDALAERLVQYLDQVNTINNIAKET